MTDQPASLRGRALAASLLLALMLAALWLLPLEAWLLEMLAWVQQHPVAGRLVYLVLFSVGSVLMVPGSLLVMCGGFLFGLWQGFLLVSVATVLGALAALLVARGIGRAWVEDRLHNQQRLMALDKAVQARGLLVVMLTRMSLLLPYNLLNYAYGLSGVGIRPYVLGTWIGMLPAVALYVYLGTLARSLSEVLDGEVSTGIAGPWLMGAGLVLAIAAVWLVHRTATRLLGEHIETDEAD
jgi:uncharacterized membrane protein YdjX (TVP38/TMEM64 family)